MVKADETWPCLQRSAWQRLNQNYMSSLLEPKREEYPPPCMNPSTRLLSSGMAFPRTALPDILSKRTGQATEARGLLHCVSPHFQTPPYIRENQYGFSHGFPEKALPNVLPVSSQKKLLVFDQCGAQTRLVYSSFFAPIAAATTKVACHYGVNDDEQIDQTKSKSVLHFGSADESDMREDTEELNALLYSDDDSDECSDEDDEVRSTGHSPFLKRQFEEIEEKVPSFNMEHEQHEGITDEVSDSNGPTKRQKLLSDTGTSARLVKSSNSDSYAESNHAVRKTGREGIRETLRVLETIVPGAKGKDPLLVLENAIEYLKRLKSKAAALGVDSLLA